MPDRGARRATTHGPAAIARLAALLACALALASRPADGQPPLARDAPALPPFHAAIDSIAVAMGRPTLRAAALPTGATREIRVYVGFDLRDVDRVMTIREDADGAHGALALWWRRVPMAFELLDPSPAALELIRRQEAARLARARAAADRVGCGDRRATHDVEVCTLAPPADTDWDAVLRRLDALGVGGLASAREPSGLDGIELVVELRDATGYRWYAWWSPDDDASDPDERAAAALLRALLGHFPAMADAEG